jgi:hypothetical protein
MKLRSILTAVACACAVLPAGASAAGSGFRNFSSSNAVSSGDDAAKVSPGTLLRRAERALSDSNTAVRPDVSPLLRRLAQRLPELRGAERRRAESLLARPTDGASDPQDTGWTAPEAGNSPSCGEHFCVHWVATGSDAPPLADGNGNGVPDQVDATLGAAENSYSVENGQLGWRAPKSDGSLGGQNGKVDIYLSNIGDGGLYGYAAPDSGQDGRQHSLHAYLVMDNDFSSAEFPGYSSPLDPLDVTIAHEYNHVLQYGYDWQEDTWMQESSAVWMEGKVYEPVHDYLQYLPGWAALSTQAITQFNGANSNDRHNVKVYGSGVWNKWLDAHYGAATIRKAWESSATISPSSFAPGAYAAGLKQSGGPGFSTEFDRFAAATAEWQAQNGGFPEGSLYPDVDRVGSLGVNSGPGSIELDHTAYGLADVPVPASGRVKLALQSPSGTTSAVALVGRIGGSPGGTLVESLRHLPKGGDGSVTISGVDRFSRLTAVFINSDIKHGDYSNSLGDWTFSRDNQKFRVAASTDFSAPTVHSRSPRPGARAGARGPVKVRFSEGVLGVSTKSFRILDSHGHSVSAKVTFKKGSKSARLTPRHRLKAGKVYRVQLRNSITDQGLNRLHAVSWRFRVR